MSKVKHFSIGDLDMKPAKGGPVHAVVNAGYSAELGAGIACSRTARSRGR